MLLPRLSNVLTNAHLLPFLLSAAARARVCRVLVGATKWLLAAAVKVLAIGATARCCCNCGGRRIVVERLNHG